MDIGDLGKQIVGGIISLTARRIVLLIINFATINLLLAKILPVSVIGVFNIANSVLAFFTFFSDIGLAAAIIQKKEVNREDLKTTFTIQEFLAIFITLLVWLSAPYFAALYGLDNSGVWLIRVLGVGFLLTSLKVVPSVLLERELRFKPLVGVEIAETVVFNGILIWLVWHGQQIEAFSWAVVARSVVGVIIIYLLAPWKIGLGISRQAARQLFSFGVPFQLNSVLALFKDRLVPLVIANMVGSTGVGYISWAQSLAFIPLEVMNIMIRVTFPAYSRLQHNPQTLRQTLEKNLFFTGVFLYPMLAGLLVLLPSLIAHVVSSKWQPALPLVYLFTINTFWATLSSPFTNVFNAVGKINITLKLMIMWTVLTWLLSPLLTFYLGFTGVALASAIISFTSIIPIVIIKRMLHVQVLKNIWQPLLGSILMALPTFGIAQILITDFLTLLITAVLGGMIYLLAMAILTKGKLFKFLVNFQNAFS